MFSFFAMKMWREYVFIKKVDGLVVLVGTVLFSYLIL